MALQHSEESIINPLLLIITSCLKTCRCFSFSPSVPDAVPVPFDMISNLSHYSPTRCNLTFPINSVMTTPLPSPKLWYTMIIEKGV